MICNNCGTDNERGFRFCVKCGCSLVDPNEVNYEQVDMGGYHSEEEYTSQNTGFSIGSGTFTINDSSAGSSGSDLYTADELNDTDEEFDFSMYEDLAAQSPEPAAMPPQPAANSSVPPPTAPPPVVISQPAANPYMNGQPGAFPQPQIIGYDAAGMPVYAQPAQPMMFQQPQILGYDAAGMPVYAQPAQPMVFPQPQILGYDAAGMPVYAQPAQPPPPMMFSQLQIIGYDPSGMPLYGQPSVPEAPVFPGNPPPAAQNGFGEQNTPPLPPEPEAYDEPSDPDGDFWKFFGDSGNSEAQTDNEDFFSRSGHIPAPPEPAVSRIGASSAGKVPEYMNEIPAFDSSAMEMAEVRKPRRNYMSDTEIVNADDLAANTKVHSRDKMAETERVDADKLASHITMRSRYSMQSAGEADPDTIEAYVPKHSKAMMAQADHAVEAMPKKVNPYESELDKIELPEYMKAKKTRHEETVEIPSLPGLE